MFYSRNNYIRAEEGFLKISMDSKFVLFWILFIILYSNLMIVSNLIILRQVWTFITFFILPGILILKTLKYPFSNIYKVILFSISLSIFFKYSIGLMLNYLFLSMGYFKPLTFYPIIIALNLGLLALCSIYYYQSRYEIFNYSFNINYKDNMLSPLVMSLIFPFISIFGSYQMNTIQDNNILILLFMLICIWFFVCSKYNKKIPDITYPIGILMVSSSILLIGGLYSSYSKPNDILGEFESFNIILSNLYWYNDVGSNRLLASLSVSLLPVIDYHLLGIDKIYIYKIVYPLLISFIPFGCFILYTSYIKPFYAFLASFFYIAQIPFMYSLTDQMRIGISLLFFISFFILYFDKNRSIAKSTLQIIFLLCLICSYYVLPLIVLYLLLMIYGSTFLIKARNPKNKSDINATYILICFIFIYVWWQQLTSPAFSVFVIYIKTALIELVTNSSTANSADVQIMLNLSGKTVPELIMIVVNDLSFVILGSSIMVLIYNCLKKGKKIIDHEYLTSMIALFGLNVFFVLNSFANTSYSGYRLYLISLIILAPAIVYWIISIDKNKSHKIAKNITLFIVVFLFIQFVSSTFVLHQVMGENYSEYFSEDSERNSAYYVSVTDVNAANWIKENVQPQQTEVLIDVSTSCGIFTFVYDEKVKIRPNPILYEYLSSNMTNNIEKNIYLFVRNKNLKNDIIFDKNAWRDNIKFSEYEEIIDRNNLVYNSNTKVYFT